MKKLSALILTVLVLAAALCGCGGSSDAPDTTGTTPAPAADKTDGKAAVDTALPATYEIAATDPHYIISTPDWKAEGYGCGFALNEKGNKEYAIVVACGSSTDESPLADAFATLYNDTFNGILMQNYRAKYEQFTPATTATTLKDGSPALLFEDVQPADDYGTKMSCPVYGYGFSHDGVPFIVAYIVVNKSAADSAKRAEMKGYVDDMINTVRTAQ